MFFRYNLWTSSYIKIRGDADGEETVIYTDAAAADGSSAR